MEDPQLEPEGSLVHCVHIIKHPVQLAVECLVGRCPHRDMLQVSLIHARHPSPEIEQPLHPLRISGCVQDHCKAAPVGRYPLDLVREVGSEGCEQRSEVFTLCDDGLVNLADKPLRNLSGVVIVPMTSMQS